MLFAGDHVMAWATTIVAPPDGAMSDYMASLRKLAKRPRADSISPATARPSATPTAFVNYYILHRKAREDSILHRLAQRRDRHSVASCARSISASIRG